MSAELAVPGEEALSAAEAKRQIDRLRQAREWVRSCSEADALSAKNDARVIRTWVRIHKASQSIAIEACRLHATALRRLCQLNSAAIKGDERAAGEWLAAMPDVKFDALLAGMRWARTPVTIWRNTQESQRQEGVYQRGRDIASGKGDPAPVDREAVTRAANELLHSALARGATSVNELTAELIDCLELHRKADEYLARHGVESIVREALRSETFDDEGHPDFVTWKDKTVGWLRIPWAAASLSQLVWMAEFRQQQAQELQGVADELTGLAIDLTKVAADHPESQRLSDLWRLLQTRLSPGPPPERTPPPCLPPANTAAGPTTPASPACSSMTTSTLPRSRRSSRRSTRTRALSCRPGRCT